MAIFIKPTHISRCLSIIEESLQNGNYFIQIGSEKGNHLKVFLTHFSIKQLKNIKKKVGQIHELKDDGKFTENEKDLLFNNYKNGTLLMLNHIDDSQDFYFKKSSDGEVLKAFLMSSGHLFLQALKEHSYGYLEHRRINFSLFLFLLASSEFTKSEKSIIQFLNQNFKGAMLLESKVAQIKGLMQEIEEGDASYWEKEFKEKSGKIIATLGIGYFIEIVTVILDLKISERENIKSVLSQFLKSVHIKV